MENEKPTNKNLFLNHVIIMLIVLFVIMSLLKVLERNIITEIKKLHPNIADTTITTVKDSIIDTLPKNN